MLHKGPLKRSFAASPGSKKQCTACVDLSPLHACFAALPEAARAPHAAILGCSGPAPARCTCPAPTVGRCSCSRQGAASTPAQALEARAAWDRSSQAPLATRIHMGTRACMHAWGAQDPGAQTQAERAPVVGVRDHAVAVEDAADVLLGPVPAGKLPPQQAARPPAERPLPLAALLVARLHQRQHRPGRVDHVALPQVCVLLSGAARPASAAMGQSAALACPLGPRSVSRRTVLSVQAGRRGRLAGRSRCPCLAAAQPNDGAGDRAADISPTFCWVSQPLPAATLCHWWLCRPKQVWSGSCAAWWGEAGSTPALCWHDCTICSVPALRRGHALLRQTMQLCL